MSTLREFDFAPMRLAHEGPRVTRWTELTADLAPDWAQVAQRVCADVMHPSALLRELKKRETFVRELPQHARAAGIEEDIIAMAMNRHAGIADTLAAIPDAVAGP